LTMLTLLVVATRVRMSVRVLTVIALVVLTLGVMIEVLQHFTGRTASAMDVIWNSVGVMLAIWGYRAWMARAETAALSQSLESSMRERGRRRRVKR
jgi:VanZ family protein